MKILKWVLIIIAVLIVIGGVGLFFFLKSFDINRYKPQIITEVSKQIDHPVTLDSLELEFSLKKGINVALHNFAILEKDAPADTMPLVKVAKTAVGVDVRSYLMARQVIITGIEIREPFIHVVQNADGSINLQALAPKQEDSAVPVPAENGSTTPGPQDAPPAFDLSTFHIRLVELSDAQIIFEQLQTDGTKKALTIKDIDAKVEDFGFGHQFPFSAKAALFSARQNIDLKGKIQLSEDFASIEILDVSLKTLLDNIDLKALGAFDPAIEEAAFKENLKGDVEIALQRLVLKNNKVRDFIFETRLTDGKIAPGALQYPIENIDMHLTGKYPTITLKEFFMYIGAGKIRSKGQVDDVLGENKFNGELILEDIRLEELIPQQETPYKLVGKLFGDIYFNGMHSPANPFDRTLAGEATFSLQEAAIKDLNVLKEILKVLAFLGVGQGIEEKLPTKYQEALQSKDTVFNKLFVHSSVAEAIVEVDTVQVEADGFSILADGTMNLAQYLTLNTNFYIPADLASVLVSENSQFLLDKEGRLNVPFRPYRGPLTKLKILPDLEKIGKDALQKKGKSELQKAIFKALDIEDPKKEEQPAPQQAPPQPESQEKAPPSEKELIENVLDSIFK